uniref:Galectin n=1 Tax=Naja naja TaxID=35670 RepID=A0A8C6Y419_NAJNA
MRLFFIFTLICALSAQQALSYYENVPGGLHPGMAVYLNGRVRRQPYEIGVDFASANWQGANIPFHFNPRFFMDKLVLNSFQAGRWGDEQVHKMPFREGEYFKVIFIVTDAGYLILLNGKLSYLFRHRIPPQSVRLIRVGGNLELQSLNVKTLPAITTSQEICHLALPYYENVPGGLHPAMAVYLNGRVLRQPYEIGVDFASANWQGANIPFHFNPRFFMDKLVLNSFQAGRWGDEQVERMPFREGEHFEVIFIVTETRYQILVNRKLLYVFRHRIPPQGVRLIRVGGNLELHSLKVITAAEIGDLILVNGNPFCKYSQKFPPQGEQLIRVDGEPEQQSLNVIARPKLGNTITASPEIYHQG